MRWIFLAISIVWCGLPCLSQPSNKHGLLFLGINAEMEPLVSDELVRLIHRNLLTDPNIMLLSREDMQLLYRKGLISRPFLSRTQAMDLSRLWGDQCYVYGTLQPISFYYKPHWFWPFLGEIRIKRHLDLKVLFGGNGKMLFNGKVVVEQIFPFQNPPSQSFWGAIAPDKRQKWMGALHEKLAKKAANRISASMKGFHPSRLIGRQELKTEPSEGESKEGNIELGVDDPEKEKNGKNEKPEQKQKKEGARDMEIPLNLF